MMPRPLCRGGFPAASSSLAEPVARRLKSHAYERLYPIESKLYPIESQEVATL